MPFTYTSQHSNIRKVKKSNMEEEFIAKKSPNYRNPKKDL